LDDRLVRCVCAHQRPEEVLSLNVSEVSCRSSPPDRAAISSEADADHAREIVESRTADKNDILTIAN
jgi:hypothetical protein